MFRIVKSQIVVGLVVLALAACAPAQAQPITSAVVPATAADSAPASVKQPEMKVHDVQVQIGVGSPIPVDAFISGELPDTCAQLAEVRQQFGDFTFEITLSVMPGIREECMVDTLPFRMTVPRNMVTLPDGTYIVKVNGASTTFTWPSAPTVTPEPEAAANAHIYRNTSIGIEFDYPAGWQLDNAGDVAMLWSERPTGPGKDGVPDNIAKIDIIAELDKTMTLEEPLARQKQDLTPEQIKSEQEVTLPTGLRAVRLPRILCPIEKHRET